MKYKIINRKKLFATSLLDIIGYSVFWPFKIFRRKKEIDRKIREILIIRTAYLGDIIMTLPILKPLKETFPQAKISFIASKQGSELLKGNPYIDTIYGLNPFWFYKSSLAEYLGFIRRIRQKKYDLVIEARGDIRELWLIVYLLKSRFRLSYGFGGGAYLLTHVVPFTEMKHRVEYHLDLVRYLGCVADGIEWGVYLKREEKEHVRGILKTNGITKPFISVHPGARLPLKRWSVNGYANLCDMMAEEWEAPIVLLGSEDERELVDDIMNCMKHTPVNLAGMMNLRELAGFLSESTLFVCNDSAPMHIASAVGTSTVAIFGPSKSIETGPYGINCKVVEKEFPCRFTCDESTCKHKVYQECMKAITPNDVFTAVKGLM